MPVRMLKVTADDHGIRVDNFIMKMCRGIPRSRVYKALRKGEVRVDKKRTKPTDRLSEGMMIRIPPWEEKPEKAQPPMRLTIQLKDQILYEDEHVLVINKPASIAVHGGTYTPWGIVDVLSHMHSRRYYLVHRLDKPVSGCLILAKSRSSCRAIQDHWSESRCIKTYQGIVFGIIREKKSLDKALARRGDTDKDRGKVLEAKSYITPLRTNQSETLVEVIIKTGRNHQIRRHLSGDGYPIVGDDKYGDFDKNRIFSKMHENSGLMLHAVSIRYWNPKGDWHTLKAAWPDNKNRCLERLFGKYE